jgi:trk system potassium uptake protein TrkH
MAIIAVGTILLALPMSHASSQYHLVDDLFQATSAVTVTGLVTSNVSATYSTFGQLVLLLLIQAGGLGYMTLFTLSMLIVGKRLSMRDRITMRQATDQPGMAGLVHFFRNILLFALAVEALGFVAIAFFTVPVMGWGQGLYMALFHAVSAFNNAGFVLVPDGAMAWQAQPWVLLLVGGLVIVGGLGYNINQELVRRYVLRRAPDRRWDTLMKLVLTASGVLLLASTLMFWLFERGNPQTLGPMGTWQQLSNAFFMAIQPRSGGFASIEMGGIENPTIMMMMVLMFLGAGPGGTAGGIKLTTFLITLAAVLATARGRDDVPVFNLKRTVSERQVRKAFTVVALSFGMVTATTIALASVEKLPFLPLLFDAVSAFSTTGLSLGITPQLSAAGKGILVVAMLVGRVGVLVIILSFITQRQKSNIHYMEDPLLIG